MTIQYIMMKTMSTKSSTGTEAKLHDIQQFLNFINVRM